MISCLWLSGCDFLTVESLAEALNAQACPGATETEQVICKRYRFSQYLLGFHAHSNFVPCLWGTSETVAWAHPGSNQVLPTRTAQNPPVKTALGKSQIEASKWNRKDSQLRLDHTTAQTIQNTIIYQKNTWRCMLKHCFFSMCKNIDPHCILRQHVWLSHSQKLRVLEMQLRSLHVVCLQLRSSQSALQQCTLREHPQLLCQSASNGNTTWKLATLVPAAQKLAILDASRLHMWSNHSRELAPGLRITIRKSVE